MLMMRGADQPFADAIGERELFGQRLIHRRRVFEPQRQPRRAIVQRFEEAVVVGVVARGVDRQTVRPSIEHRHEELIELRSQQHGLDAGPRLCLLLAQELPDVMLPSRVRRRDEQDFAAPGTARQEDQDGVWLLDAGQVEQIAVLAVFVINVSRVDAGGRAP
jgi:hypothetical protein